MIFRRKKQTNRRSVGAFIGDVAEAVGDALLWVVLFRWLDD